MTTHTRPRPSSMRRTPTRAQQRPRRAPRGTTTGFRPSMPRRRSQPQKSGLQGLISKAVPSGLSAKSTSKAGSAAKKPASMALLAGAAGLAYKNREKIGGMLGRHKDDEQRQQHAEPYVAPNATMPHAATPPQPPTTGL